MRDDKLGTCKVAFRTLKFSKLFLWDPPSAWLRIVEIVPSSGTWDTIESPILRGWRLLVTCRVLLLTLVVLFGGSQVATQHRQNDCDVHDEGESHPQEPVRYFDGKRNVYRVVGGVCDHGL